MHRLAKLAVAALLLFVPANVFSCGPFFDDVIFTYTKHPDLPLKDYAAGKLGIVAPTYARSYLYVAYQYLSGKGFAPAQQGKLADFWRARFSQWPSNVKDSPDWRYFELRKRYAPKPPDPPQVYVTMRRFDSALNCNPDAFVTAARTLEDRARKFGESSEAFRDWLTGQDAVFQNCPGGDVLPKPVSANAPALLRADRDYQLAAAHFYSGKLDEAQAAFSRITQDRSSPWSRIAAYLRLRTMIRKASMAEHNEAALLAAEKEIDSYLRDRAHAYFRNDAVLLRGYIEVQLHPERRMMELLRLLRDPRDPNLWQDLWDVLVLVDRMEGEDVWNRTPDSAVRLMAASRSARASSDLLDWMLTYQSPNAAAAQHALAKWKSDKNDAWLVAAISKATPDSPDAAALIEATAKLAPDSPAFATANYHAVRLLAASKQVDAARERLGALPANSAMPPSAANAFSAQRAALAVTFDDFLENAPARPAAVVMDDGGDEELPFAWDEKVDSSGINPRPVASRLPAESAAIFNLRLPLQSWVEASQQERLPVEIRRDLVLAGWTRAVLLSDHATARSLAPETGRMFPVLAQQMREYAAASETAAADASLLLLLRYPGFRPYVSPDQRGRGRFEEESDQRAGALALERMDSYHDNWWCEDLGAKLVVDYREDKPDDGKPKPDPPSPRFLSDADRQLAAEQWTRLHAVGAAPQYLLRATLAWARRAPSDARVPEALSRAIRAGHLGCADRTSTALSKQAFQLLHRRYPRTAWAKKTPYYY